MTEKQRIYPVFLPHAGCPFQCVYCNQRLVTSGGAAGFSAQRVLTGFQSQFDCLLDAARRCGGEPGELAFYGGTFTALSEDLLRAMLERVSPWVEQGVFSGIRFSTRPDTMSSPVCRLLRAYPIRTVELGVQSLSDAVLSASRRGYRAQVVRESAARVRTHGWQLGIQLMPGLPGDDRQNFLHSVAATIALRPDLVRLYPALVLPETVLARWYRQGRYRPLGLERAVAWCAAAYGAFRKAKIRVARMGLHADPELQKPGAVLAGPWHPSFGYLVKVRWWRDRVDAWLEGHLNPAAGWQPSAAAEGLAEPVADRRLTIHAANHLISEVLGPQRSNIRHWRERWHLRQVRVQGEPAWPAERLDCRWE